MILRDYICPKCGRREDDIHQNGRDILCPDCQATMSKVFCAPALKFNGDGWTPKFHNGQGEHE